MAYRRRSRHGGSETLTHHHLHEAQVASAMRTIMSLIIRSEKVISTDAVSPVDPPARPRVCGLECLTGRWRGDKRCGAGLGTRQRVEGDSGAPRQSSHGPSLEGPRSKPAEQHSGGCRRAAS